MVAQNFKTLSVFIAEQFKESVSEPSPNTNIYLTYGRVGAWSNESSPDSVTTSDYTIIDTWNNMIGGKRVTGSDIRHVIPRYTWTANTKYVAYDHRDYNLLNTQFYVITSTKDVYKCIANNYSANSTVEPSAVSSNTTTQTSDGYIWKYMYSISDSDLLRFGTSSYIPVQTLSADDGSTQWDVQSDAVDGGIYSILITNAGAGYTNSSNIVVTISGDGTSATATASLNATSQTVSSITVTNPGTGYTRANVIISLGGGAGATATAIISPPGGHGSNPIYELGGSSLLLNPKLNTSESGKLPTTNDYRQIALIKDPYIKGTSNIISNLVFLQAMTLTTVGSSDYTQDEYVYQGSSLSAATFSGQVLSSSNGVVTVINTTGTPVAGTLVGASSATAKLLNAISDKEVEPLSGQLLWLDNITKITRNASQSEDFKIVLKF